LGQENSFLYYPAILTIRPVRSFPGHQSFRLTLDLATLFCPLILDSNMVADLRSAVVSTYGYTGRYRYMIPGAGCRYVYVFTGKKPWKGPLWNSAHFIAHFHLQFTPNDSSHAC